ncbi:DUF1566 domain-containing protein [Thioflexithrix psekupsensis]|uniref:Lcl C-terminal domain-containing protein n=1 Tax=Thioflexithrix psekupsensis TaxID=1570016 RepID=A0A251XAB7_9GAMM|nr:DUF1566 domain-containing protein [Thioflexithrix psekupsensis]OUD15258.1 hypothetical protein TPSD3_01635 [Thioflexithrix psekupsensis]
MDSSIRQHLQEMIRRYGTSLCGEPKRCKAILNDLCPTAKKEIRLLISALEEDIGNSLLNPPNGIPMEMLLQQLIKRLHEELSLQPEAAHWTVETWALALGVIKQPFSGNIKPNNISNNVITPDPVQKNPSPSFMSKVVETCALALGIIKQSSSNNVITPNPVQKNPSTPVSKTHKKPLIKDRYQDNGDGTVTDVKTNLQWMRCLIGQAWQNGRCHGEAREMSWDEARKLKIRFAGHSDWRLPTIEELRSLVYCSSGEPAYFPNNGERCEGDYQCPTIVQEAFPDAPQWFVWSSSPVAGYTNDAWLVNFGNGNGNYGYRSNDYHVRLVRGGQ